MKTFYLTADKVGDFIARMWQAGIEASIEPKSNQITIKGAFRQRMLSIINRKIK